MNKTISLYISLYSIALWIGFFGCINTGFFSGDLKGVKVSLNNYELFVIAIIYQFIIFLSFLIFLIVTRYKFTLGKYCVEIVNFKFSILLFVVLIMHIAFVSYTELVRFLEEILISLVYISITAPVLYSFSITLLLEKMPERFFFINVLLFVLLELLKGWSGFLLTIFMFEIYFYIKRNSSSRLLKIPFLFSITLPFILLLSGGFLYKHIYILKNDIRGISVVSDNLEYIDAVEMLSDRLTNFSTAAGVYSRYDSVVDIAKLQNEYAEIKGFFRPLVPNFIMENKSFSALNNSAMLAFFPDYRDDSSVDLGFVMYYYVLFESRVSDAFFIVCFLSFFFMC
ncbi:oligosaccharide repeat unit polymerase, partial [Yersinia pestis]|uniref:oligosaccharide repeat unit polymerase n=1 Tax=Yersinia pestis TaxID=632 RepID=UPI001300AA80